jgi:hypothetical protein
MIVDTMVLINPLEAHKIFEFMCKILQRRQASIYSISLSVYVGEKRGVEGWGWRETLQRF